MSANDPAWRRIILQIHLWSALICSLYIIVISLSGSAVVLRREFGRWFAAPTFVQPQEVRLEEEALRAIIASEYPEFTITEISGGAQPRLTLAVYLERGERQIERRYNPYTGEDLGDPYPVQMRIMSWLVELHDNLLTGTTGRRVNGFGGMFFTLIILTGAVLWWPGKRLWRKSLSVSWRQRGYIFLWRLHSAVGFWTFPLLLVWGLTAIYFAFPLPVEIAIDYFDADPMDFDRPGEAQLLALVAAHFGRFGPLPVRFVWITLGLVPILLFVSGFLIWRRRTASQRVSG